MSRRNGSDTVVLSAPDVPNAPSGGVPAHVAVIMDGNNRWAKRRGLPGIEGHRAGARALRTLVEACVEHGVGVLTVFAFSSENWRRPPGEVSGLMELFVQALSDEVPSLHENDICVRFIGQVDAFDHTLQRAMSQAANLTQNNKSLILNVAINYGGRWDITHAAQRLAQIVKSGEVSLDMIDEPLFASCLSLHGLPDVDLCIRTGGEYRISNFLLWQVAYAELYFSKRLWPDFDGESFLEALAEFSHRQRRFGRTQEQLQQLSSDGFGAEGEPGSAVKPDIGEPAC